MAIPAIPEVRELMEAGVHFGHASGKWHPKMAPYIFATRDKLHIIDLEKTREQLEKVLTVLEDRVRSGKTVVLVGTKKQVRDQVKEIGERLQIPYVNERWLGGTMTNWGEMQQSISRMKKIEAHLASEESTGMIKKERVRLEAELRRMHAKFGGMRDMAKKPDALFIIDPSYEHNAVKEALHQGVELFAIVDTNSNPTAINHVIPANDDGPKSLALLLELIAKTIEEGKKLISVAADNEEKTAAEPEVTVEVAEEVEEVAEQEEKKTAKTAKAKPATKDEEEKVEADEEKAEEKKESKSKKGA